MKVIKLINKDTPFYGSGIILDLDSIHFFKNGKLHREDGPARIVLYNFKRNCYYYNGIVHLNIKYTNKTWKRKAKSLKRLENLKIFI